MSPNAAPPEAGVVAPEIAVAPEGVAAPPVFASGEHVAPGYRVVAHLNRGNRLDIYDVWSESRSCRCIAKTLRPDRAREPRARRLLMTEGRLLQRFTHPHLVRAYEITQDPERRIPVVILETLGGETLSHVLDRLDRAGRRLPVTDAVVLGQQLCSAMHYLHANGLLHLDLKPSNIIAEGGRAKVLDLSIAMPPGPGRRGCGTYEYMAPEQARGDEVTAAADVWGIGMVLFDALTGRSPWDADDDTADEATGEGEDGEGVAGDESSIELYEYRGEYPQLLGRAPPVSRYRRLPRPLSSLIDACLEPEPAARPAFGQLAARLALLMPASLPAPVE